MSAKRSKDWGYEVEVQTLDALRGLSPDFRRTGASNQKEKGAADIVLDAPAGLPKDALTWVVTKEKGRGSPLMVSLPMEQFLHLVTFGFPAWEVPIYVSVKGRAKMYLASVYRELLDWVRSTDRRPKPKPPKMTRGGYGGRMP